ncbi:Elongation factor Tu GTP-binding domain containing protein [Gracilaria domingensis]|nr:Elongation factor Tu GTP-binding domain containing protein [Gracilaria domingensis]
MFRSGMSSRQLSISSTATRSVKDADRGSSNFNLRVSTEPLSNEAAPSRLPHSSVPQPFGFAERHCPEQATQVARRQIDLNGEVEAALPVCDGTFIVVDVVDDVCLQTVTLLRAALRHEVRPKLVLNKIDRLFVELYLDPREAYEHILGTLVGVKDRMGMRQVEQMMAAASELESEAYNESDWSLQEDLPDEHDSAISVYISPDVGNVVYASAVDAWAFRIIDIAKFFYERQGISRRVLNKTLYAEYYVQSKTKPIVKRNATDVRSKSKPMFVLLIMSTYSCRL